MRHVSKHQTLTVGHMQLAPPVSCIFRIRDGDDSNDHDDVEDDG